ncbi:MAG: hypothetical protein V1816_18350 [Pseudomonadota bacterium]
MKKVIYFSLGIALIFFLLSGQIAFADDVDCKIVELMTDQRQTMGAYLEIEPNVAIPSYCLTSLIKLVAPLTDCGEAPDYLASLGNTNFPTLAEAVDSANQILFDSGFDLEAMAYYHYLAILSPHTDIATLTERRVAAYVTHVELLPR